MVEYNLSKISIVEIVNQIILYAAKHNASDIHFDPRENTLMIRMRIDGALKDHASIPKVFERNLITRIKLVSGMNITESRLPQDGAIKGRIEDKDLDMRVSALPTNEGEKIVIRILDFQKSLQGIESLGFSKENEAKVKKMMSEPNGIILVTGATGSGKSTTTYSMLQALNKSTTNIITVEDPIEMNIEGINQVQVNSEIGMTFANALRSILRQDPNVILIGEIRDSETAQIAIRSAITGHLVLSTIHTNSSLSTIERLLDMNVQRYLLSTALTGIISQKLARTLCSHCKKLRPVTKYEKYLFKGVLNKNIKDVYEPVGCDKCGDGFAGRIALHEVLLLSDRLRTMLADENTDKDEIKKSVYDGDTKTLLQDALEKIIAGYTTFQEVYRVVDIDVDLDNSIRKQMGLDVDNKKKNYRPKVHGIRENNVVVYYNSDGNKLNNNDLYDDQLEDIDKLIDQSKDDDLKDGLDIFESDINLEAIKNNGLLLDNNSNELNLNNQLSLSTLASNSENIEIPNTFKEDEIEIKTEDIIDAFKNNFPKLGKRRKLEIIDAFKKNNL